MDLRLDQLPDDAESLKAIIAAQALKAQERERQIEACDDEIAGLKARNQTLQELNDRLDHHLRVLKRTQFGRRSEKLDPDQLALLLEDAEQAIGEIQQAQEAL